MFTKNERGYRFTAKYKRIWSLLILLLSVASIRRKLLKKILTEERSVFTNSERCNIRLRSEINKFDSKQIIQILQPIIIDFFFDAFVLVDTSLFFVRYVSNVSVPRRTTDTLRAETPRGQLIVVYIASYIKQIKNIMMVVYFSTYTYPPYSTCDLRQIRYITHPTYKHAWFYSCNMAP